jgi:hypothetical protein
VSNLAIALEEQVERTILGVDQVMRFAHAEWQGNPAGFDLKVWMSRASFLSDLSLQIAMSNAAGDVVATSLDAPSAPRINIADRSTSGSTSSSRIWACS